MAADGHRADAELPADRPQRLAFQHPQAQDRGLARRKALQQGVSGHAGAFGADWLFARRRGEDVQQRPFAWADCIEALMAPGVNAFLVLAAGDPHQATVIAQVLLQGSLLTQLQVGSRGAASRLETGSGADELKAGHLAGAVELDQMREALLKVASQSIGQRQKLPNHRIAAGVRSEALKRGAADCVRHDGRSKGPNTPLGGVKGPPRPEIRGAAEPINNRRTCAALEATRTMKKPVRILSQLGTCTHSTTHGTCAAPYKPSTNMHSDQQSQYGPAEIGRNIESRIQSLMRNVTMACGLNQSALVCERENSRRFLTNSIRTNEL